MKNCSKNKKSLKLTESQFRKMISNMITETVEHFRNKWGYPDLGNVVGNIYDPWDNELIDKLNVVIEKYGWEISPMSKTIERRGKQYYAYICIPNETAPKVGDWGYVAADLNTIANQHGMVIEQGRYKGIVNNKPEEKPVKKMKRGVEPEATPDKKGVHYFIIKPRSEGNF